MLEVARDLLGCTFLVRRRRRPPRRGRGLPRRRPRQPRLPRPDRAQRGDVRPARPALRLLHRWACTSASTSSASPKARPRRCCCERSNRLPALELMRRSARGRARRRAPALQRARRSSPRRSAITRERRRRAGLRRRRPVARRCARAAAPRRRPGAWPRARRASQRRRASASPRGAETPWRFVDADSRVPLASAACARPDGRRAADALLGASASEYRPSTGPDVEWPPVTTAGGASRPAGAAPSTTTRKDSREATRDVRDRDPHGASRPIRAAARGSSVPRHGEAALRDAARLPQGRLRPGGADQPLRRHAHLRRRPRHRGRRRSSAAST